MNCPSCGSAVERASARFCSECGKRLVEPEHTAWPSSGRRRITVMFCDIIDSMSLEQCMDAEDWREVTLAYRALCRDVIRQYGGGDERFQGDGILVPFGVPVAGEDDARRAVQAALDITGRMPGFSRWVEQRHGCRIAVRIGVHTGRVVIDPAHLGSMSQDNVVFGDALSVGARVQEVAGPNGVVVSEDCFRLVQGHFIVESLGVRQLKGVPQEMPLYRVVEASSARSLFEARAATGLSPMINRVEQLQALLQEWEQARQGQVRSVLISGEPGIGKSRLLYEVTLRLEHQNVVPIICYCNVHFQNTAFHPLAGELSRIFAFERGDDRDRRLGKVREALERLGITEPQASTRLALMFADPVGPAVAAAAGGVAGEQARREAIELLVRYVAAAAQRVPLLLIFEDLHWADPSTMEFLRQLCASARAMPVLILASHRAEIPVDLTTLTRMELGRIDSTDCQALVQAVSGSLPLPEPVMEQVVRRSDGVPLFVEELTKSVRETLSHTGPLEEDELVVPASLQESLMARLDRLGSAKEVAQVAASVGRTFRLDLLSALWDESRPALASEIEQLVGAGLIFRKAPAAEAEGRPGEFEFKHELVRGAAYESLLRAARRDIHARIAATLESRFAAETAAVPELLAHHCAQADLPERAIALWELAGRRAIEKSANLEAIAHLSRALSVLETLPEDRTRQAKELDLQLALAAPVMAAKGYGAPELDRVVARGMTLSEQVGDHGKIFPLVYSRWSFQHVTGQFGQALQLARRSVEVAERYTDAEPRIVAYRLLGMSQYSTGQPAAAIGALRRTLDLFEPDKHTALAYKYGGDLKMLTLVSLAFAQWTCGHGASARNTIDEAWARATALGHVHTLAYCASYRLGLWTIWQRLDGFEELLGLLRALAVEHKMPIWTVSCRTYDGWLLTRRGEYGVAVETLREAIRSYRSLNMTYLVPSFMMWLIEAQMGAREYQAAQASLEEARDIIARTGECWAEPELYRHWAHLRLRTGGDAAEMFDASLRTATEQGAHAWWLRSFLDAAALPDALARGWWQALPGVLAEIPADEAGADHAAARALLAAR